MSQALYVHEAQNSTLSDADQVEIAKWQAAQVSTISFMNFSGRIFIGLFSDVVKARLGQPRSYLLVLVSFFVLVSQLTASHIDKLVDLWKASALLGLGYGTVFSLFAALCVEWFGVVSAPRRNAQLTYNTFPRAPSWPTHYGRGLALLFSVPFTSLMLTGFFVAHFSENWGYLSLAPMVGGNLFSIAFGRNLDAHEKAAASEPNPQTFAPKPEKELQCLDGKACYVDSIHLTTIACVVAMGLSAWAAWRDKKQHEDEIQKLNDARTDIIWEGDE
ncbi:hypothetical protein AAF712_001596 [Marasmius tenuissimus]|uniref:Uncharacterized protein n=1 Tax=Marasmius tenuissimus TaxID=585030 RepID=A0ABR3ABE8_9AGAR